MVINMPRIPKMTPSTITTILNSAPMVIQGASKLINLIKEQGASETDNKDERKLTLESLKSDIERLESRLDAVDKSNIEQIKLIEELAKQNEALATSMSKAHSHLQIMNLVVLFVGIITLVSLLVMLLK
jgi:hypothetical protein